MKIKSLFLSENVFKWKYLWCFNILQKAHNRENSNSYVIKKSSRSIRYENSLILNISRTDLRRFIEQMTFSNKTYLLVFSL